MPIRRHEIGRPIIDLNPPPGHYALQQFHQNPFKMGAEAQARALDADTGWLFGDNPFKMGAILALTDVNPEGLPPYNFAMGRGAPASGTRPPSVDAGTFARGLAAARRRAR